MRLSMGQTARATIIFDTDTRNMLRALCDYYSMPLSQVVRQIVRAQYHSLFPGQAPGSAPLRPLDRDRGERRERDQLSRAKSRPGPA